MKKATDDEKTKSGKTQFIRWGEQATKLTLSKCKLTMMSGENKGKEFVLVQPVIHVGSKKENELVLKDETISRIHFEIHQTKEGYLLKDAESLNGTFINGLRVKEAYLTSGALIRAGKTEMKFLPMDETFDIVPSKKTKFVNLIGGSTAMRKIYTIIEKIAPTDVTVVPSQAAGCADVSWKSKRGYRSFTIERAEDAPVPVYHVIGNTTKKFGTFNSMVSGRKYWFRVASVGPAGQSAWSDPVPLFAP